MSTALDPRTVDLNDPRLYDDPWAFYRWLRDEQPVWWNEASGLYAISRYDDIVDISCHPERYSSAAGVRPVPVKISLIDTDDPEHARLRRLISRGFTPRQVRKLAEHVRELANEILDEVQARGRIEFVADFAVHVPLIVIAELMGLDPATRGQLYRWSDAMMAADGETDLTSAVMQDATTAFAEYSAVCAELIEARRTSPTEDLVSLLTKLHDDGVDGEPDVLSDDELMMFCTLLVVAGNETTRNAIAGGLRALSSFPDEREKLLADPSLIDSAVEEILRFVSPVLTMVRTVTEDHSRDGVDLRAGDRLLLLYQSANRDERVFDDPDSLRVDRSPNPHIAFGFGPHYCLGANLARLEVKIVFQELLRRLPDIRVEDPDRLPARARSTLVLGIESLPAVFTPVA
jgi:cytochrome P450 family 142 subfamily A polypeptide 1